MGAMKSIKQLAEEHWNSSQEYLYLGTTKNDIIAAYEAGYAAACEGKYDKETVIGLLTMERLRSVKIIQNVFNMHDNAYYANERLGAYLKAETCKAKAEQLRRF